MKPSVTLYVDVVSPFTYIAFHVLRTSPVFKDCEVQYVPVFLGGIMKACNNIPPIRIKNKDKWSAKERLHWARLFNVPTAEKMPPGFPALTVHVQRILCALEPSKLVPAIAALYHAEWAESKDITQQDVMNTVLSNAIGAKETEAAIQKSTSEETKKLLTDNTDKAMEEGAFGLPWFTATNAKGETEGFWGFDHLAQVVVHLGLDKPTDTQGWSSML